MIDYKEAFTHLKDEIRTAGLLKRSPKRGILEMTLILLSYTLVLYFAERINIVLLGLLFSVIFTRSVFVSHDLLHGQYFKNKSFNRRVSYLFSSLFIGLSGSWWDHKHNINHHTWTNCPSKDADILALDRTFTNDPGDNFLVAHFAHQLFWGALFFMYVSFIAQSLKFVIKRKKRVELFFMLLHYPLFYGTLFYMIDASSAVATIAIMHLSLSLWLSLGFITNHLGCAVLDEKVCNDMSWMELQLRTSRNVRGGWFIHWFFGGLNTQIEHHLYPKAPRYYLLKAAKITEAYCIKHGIAYNSVSAFRAYKEIDDAITKVRG